ncbi:MAG TPA: ankyrin repeat domain-containing protein [Urbifossiella sp.]|nr:ankyrin repeat domain-containing protein [Urbifossiella sp.]
MSNLPHRRSFTALTAGFVLGAASDLTAAPELAPMPRRVPAEAPFDFDYPPPNFQPSWRRPQINRRLVADFVVYAHSDPAMTSRLLDKEPGLVNAYMDWGGGDWESGLGGASHMGRRDIVNVLLDRGARPDLFCAAMLGLTDTVRAFLTLQPKLIDARGPHGFTLHFHAQVGGREAEATLEYLQSVKKIELRPVPFLKK